MKDFFIAILIFSLVYTWFSFAENNTENQLKVEQEQLTQKLALRFFNAWSSQVDPDSIQGYFASKALLKDELKDTAIEGRQAIRSFMPWGYSNLEILGARLRALNIEQVFVMPGEATVYGQINPHKIGSLSYVKPMPFVAWLKFNAVGEIEELVWWQKR